MQKNNTSYGYKLAMTFSQSHAVYMVQSTTSKREIVQSFRVIDNIGIKIF